MALQACRECGKEISSKAQTCPHCGIKISRVSGGVIAVIGVIAIMGIALLASNSNSGNAVPAAATASPIDPAEDRQSIAAPVATQVAAPAAVTTSLPQKEFEAARRDRYNTYVGAINEIQKSAIFNDANRAMNAVLKRYGTHITNWSGVITSLTTSHGGKDVSVKIQSASGVTYRIKDEAPVDSPIYNQLASLQKGQEITFSGDIQRMGSSGEKWEYSLTEFGSLEEPVFLVKFDSIEAKKEAVAQARRLPPVDVQDAVANALAAGQQNDSRTAPAMRRASFDCALAKSTTEHLICDDDELAALDRDLSGLLTQAKQEANDKAALNADTRTAWNWREKNCRDKACLLQWYSERKIAYQSK